MGVSVYTILFEYHGDWYKATFIFDDDILWEVILAFCHNGYILVKSDGSLKVYADYELGFEVYLDPDVAGDIMDMIIGNLRNIIKYYSDFSYGVEK